jgi:hypothetical protein
MGWRTRLKDAREAQSCMNVRATNSKPKVGQLIANLFPLKLNIED